MSEIDPGTVVIPEYETRIAHAAAAADQDAVNALTEEYHAARKAASKTVAVKEKPAPKKRKPAKAVAPTPKATPVDRPTSVTQTETRTTPPAVGGGGNVG